MSDTPRTDAATFWGRDMGSDSATPHFECVDADFARELERENAKLKQATQKANTNNDE